MGCAIAAAKGEEILDQAQFTTWLRQQYNAAPEKWPSPTLDPTVKHVELATPKPLLDLTDETVKARVSLGNSLFFDPRLSASLQISCARCHDPEHGWSDGRSLSQGVFMESLHRNTPGLQGVGFAKSWFWDGRASSLENQALQVMLNPKEMAGDPSVIIRRLQEEKDFYPPRFAKAFGDEQITMERIASALADFQRSLPVGRSAFDAFLAGKSEALSDAALRGLHLFRTKARCMNCHNGAMMSDDQFHNVGLTYYGRKYQDLGRFVLTAQNEDVGRFRTPSLRNLPRTGPWMHNGFFPSLRGVVNMYNVGMPHQRRKAHEKNDPRFPSNSPLLKALQLTDQEKSDLVTFLESLAEPPMRVLDPPFPPIAKP